MDDGTNLLSSPGFGDVYDDALSGGRGRRRHRHQDRARVLPVLCLDHSNTFRSRFMSSTVISLQLTVFSVDTELSAVPPGGEVEIE